MKAMTAVIITACVMAAALVSMPVPAFAADAGDARTKVGNLVFVVRYAGETVGDGSTGFNAIVPSGYTHAGDTYWQRFTDETYDADTSDVNTPPSLREYIATASGGTVDVRNSFPQTQRDGKVQYITLDHDADYYTSQNADDGIIREVVAKSRSMGFAKADLDRNGDGYLDNLTIIGSVANTNTPNVGRFFGHEATFSDESQTIGSTGLKVSSYNMVYSLYSPSSTLNLRPYGPTSGLVVHEFIHTFGAPDLYRHSSDVSADIPVGIWDIMAGTANGLSWPTAQTKKDIGWPVDMTEQALGAADGESHTMTKSGQAMVFRSPLSDSEYFVVEYRTKQGSTAKPDGSLKGSGIIVYRIDTKVEHHTNIEGKDYQYVFRPNGGYANKDALDAQAGLSAFGATRTSIGSTDMSKGLSDGAVTLADGSNSGLAFEVTGQTDGSITFKVTHADYGALGLWNHVTGADGRQAFDGVTIQSPKADSATDGTNLYALGMSQANPAVPQVRKFDGTNWTTLDASSITGYNAAALAWHDGRLYLAAASYTGNGIALFSWDTSGGKWDTVATLTSTTFKSALALGSAGGRLVLVADANAYVMEGGSLVRMGGSLGSSVSAPTVTTVGGVPAVVYGDTDTTSSRWTSATKVARYIDGAWSIDAISGFNGAASVIGSVTVGGSTYAMLSAFGKTPVLVKLTNVNGALIQRALTLKDVNLSSDGSLVADANHLYMTGVAGNGAVLTHAVALADLMDEAFGTGSISPGQLGEQVDSGISNVSSQIVSGNVIVVSGMNSSAISVRGHAVLPASPKEHTYKVERYQQNTEGTGYALADTEKGLKATTGDMVTAADKAYKGFVKVETGQSVESAAMPDDDSLVLRVYYNRNRHTVSYRTTGAPSGAPAAPAAVLVRYGATVTVATAPAKVDGWTFGGWKTADATVSGGRFTMPDKDVAFIGTWTKDSPGPDKPMPQPVKVTGVKVSGSASLTVGDSATLNAAVSPSNAANKAVAWSSSDRSVATVDASGKVTAVKAGKAVITATAKDGSGKKGTLTVTVKAKETVKPSEPGKPSEPSKPSQPSKPTECTVSFKDVTATTPHSADIAWLACQGISKGYGDGTYGGMRTVVRQDMAAFLYRMAGSPAYTPSATDRARFKDVNDKTPHAREIWWLASTGIAKGYKAKDGTVTFGGMRTVVRQDMAAFLRRYATWAKASPTLGRVVSFKDVTSTTPHADDIVWLARTGVTKGYGDGTFGGMRSVVRQDMAAFLHRMSTNVLAK